MGGPSLGSAVSATLLEVMMVCVRAILEAVLAGLPRCRLLLFGLQMLSDELQGSYKRCLAKH